jgi:hypothetical protein
MRRQDLTTLPVTTSEGILLGLLERDAAEIGGPEWPAETSTVIRFHEGRVVSMQDYRTEAEALAVAE